MRTVNFMRVFGVVFLVVFLFVRTVCAHPSGQHGGEEGTGPIRYNRESLLLLRTLTDTRAHRTDHFPEEMTADTRDTVNDRVNKRRRGQRGGVKRRLRRNKTRPTLPSVILSNVRSIRPNSPNLNFEELQANVSFISEYRDACVLCFSETWYCENVTDDSVALKGFGTPFRTDRDKDISNKQQGGGVCLYVNERWCGRANECHCQKEAVHARHRPDFSVTATALFAP